MAVLVAITGASGTIYGVELLKKLDGDKLLVISETGEKVLKHENNLSVDDLKQYAKAIYENKDLSAPVSSGSVKLDAMVVIPCSMSTLAKISVGIADNLITRAASVCLKERMPLILVPRETPLSTIHLEAMGKVSVAGGVILPACPAFYHGPDTIDDLVSFIVGKVLEQMGTRHRLYEPWPGLKK
jgi:4-hydroxy-3-polyprenylbenzoate decarboxylase